MLKILVGVIFLNFVLGIGNVHAKRNLSCVKNVCIGNEFTAFEIGLIGKHNQKISECSEYLQIFYQSEPKKGVIEEKWALLIELVQKGEGNSFKFENNKKEIVTIYLNNIVQIRRTRRTEYKGSWFKEALGIEQYIKANYGRPNEKIDRPNNVNFIQYNYNFLERNLRAHKRIHVYDDLSASQGKPYMRIEELLTLDETAVRKKYDLERSCKARKYFS